MRSFIQGKGTEGTRKGVKRPRTQEKRETGKALSAPGKRAGKRPELILMNNGN